MYIKGIYDTVADTISWLDYGPIQEVRSTMMTFAQCWCNYNSGQEATTSPSTHTQESMNLVFANQDDEDAMYPWTTRKIAEEQKSDIVNTMSDKHGYTKQIVENTKVLCKNGKMVIPTSWLKLFVGYKVGCIDRWKKKCFGTDVVLWLIKLIIMSYCNCWTSEDCYLIMNFSWWSILVIFDYLWSVWW